jgi:hypothetical protein
VTSRGCTLITDPAAIARYRAVPLVPWAPGVREQFVTIPTELVEGLRVRRSPGSSPGGIAQLPDLGRGAKFGRIICRPATLHNQNASSFPVFGRPAGARRRGR